MAGGNKTEQPTCDLSSRKGDLVRREEVQNGSLLKYWETNYLPASSIGCPTWKPAINGIYRLLEVVVPYSLLCLYDVKISFYPKWSCPLSLPVLHILIPFLNRSAWAFYKTLDSHWGRLTDSKLRGSPLKWDFACCLIVCSPTEPMSGAGLVCAPTSGMVGSLPRWLGPFRDLMRLALHTYMLSHRP